jgi:hypothetical protein
MQVHSAPPQKGLAVTAKSTKSKKSAPTKSAKTHKSPKPRPANPSHFPTPWLKLKQMWEAGESYEAMAKATDAHYDVNKPDPTKPTRAKIWKARNVGVKIDGKLIRFGARGKVKEKAKQAKAEKNDAKGKRLLGNSPNTAGGSQPESPKRPRS